MVAMGIIVGVLALGWLFVTLSGKMVRDERHFIEGLNREDARYRQRTTGSYLIHRDDE